MANRTARLVNIEFSVQASEDLILRGPERSIVRVPANSTYECLMIKTQKFASLFRHYSKNHGLDKDGLAYYFTNELKPDDTPDSVHLQEHDIIIVKERKRKLHCSPSSIERSYDSKYFNDMRKLLEESEHYDVTFLVGSSKTTVHAHKVILSARSDFFLAMFRKGGLRESCEGVVTILNDDVAPVKRMLEFIYTNRISDLNSCDTEDIIGILKLSEQYLLPSLKELCEQAGIKKISTDSVAKLLNASEKFNALKLRESCYDYILNNIDEVTESPSFQQQLDEHPQLAMSVLKVAVRLTRSRGRPTKKQRIKGPDGISIAKM